MQTFLRSLSKNPEVAIHRDPATGLAWAQWQGRNGQTVFHFTHPWAAEANALAFAASEVHGWTKDARIVAGPAGLAVNASVVTHARDTLDAILRAECKCGGRHE